MSAARGRWWAPVATTCLALAFALSGIGSVAHAAASTMPRAQAPAVTCTVFLDSSLIGIPADLVYHPTDGRIWFTEQGPAATISALHPSTNAITRFPTKDPVTGKGISVPQGITVGSDGAIWFTGLADGRIGRLTTAGAMSYFPPLSDPPISNPTFVDITTGADGNLWITANQSSRIYRLTPSGAFTSFALPGKNPWGITAGGGAVWFAAPGSDEVGSFTPSASPSFTYYGVGEDASNIVVDAAGQAWFTMPEASKIGRVIPGPVPVITIVATRTDYARPDGITVGFDGGIWFTEFEAAQIGRADPLLFSTPGYEPAEQIITLPDQDPGPGPIVALPDGTIWFGEEIRKIAHFTGTASGAVPLPPQATVIHKDGPAPVVDPSTSTLVYSTSTVLEVRATAQGVCIDQIVVQVAPCAGGAFLTIADVSAATATFQLPGDGCWTIRITVSGPGGTTILPDTTSVVNDSLFPDTVDPVLTVPANITVPATSTAGAAVSFAASATDDQPGAIAITCTPPSGSVFTAGATTVVTCTAVDAAGNKDSGTFTVTVAVPAPTISVPADITVPATGVTTRVPFTVAGSSIVDSQLRVTCIVPNSPPQTSLPGSPSYGQFTPDFPPLLTTVTCRTEDSHGQSATASFTVNVTLALPTISAVVTYDTGAQAGTPYVFGTWTRESVRVDFVCPSVATTFCPADAVFGTTGPDQNVTGTTTDAAGRTATLTVGNIDIDKTAPETVPAASGTPAAGGRFALSAAVTLTASDAHSGVNTITYTIETFAFIDQTKTAFKTTSVTTAPVTVAGGLAGFTLDGARGFEGRNVIRYTTTDAAGNVEPGTFPVVVVNTIETRTTITSVRTLVDGRIEITAQVTYLYVPGQVVPAGHFVVFGTTTTAGTATGTIAADGTATAILPALAPGVYTVTASFVERMPYLKSDATKSGAIAAQATSFVIWGGNASGVQLAQRIQFWGSGWTKQVTGGKAAFKANSSFKGWGGTVTGTTWSTKGGNTTEPKTIGSYITVIVTTATDKDGKWDRGNVVGYAVLRVEDPAKYAANPGHDAFGRVVQAP